jgi:glycosyltransferase involved in cell wall biosynthesis
MPKVSIITVVFNAEQDIEDTIRSVVNQTYQDKEYIVIDGGSTDSTISIINQYKNNIDVLVSEKDGGIYDAMNKGLALAKGEWVSFMNAGDSFYTNEVITEFFKNDSGFKDALIAYGDVSIADGRSAKIIKQHTKDIRYDSICHQGEFISRKALLAYGGYDKTYKVYADFDFQLKVFLEGADKLVYKPVCVANYNLKGVSSKMFYHFLPEYLHIIRKIPFIQRLSYFSYAFRFAAKSFLYEKWVRLRAAKNGA